MFLEKKVQLICSAVKSLDTYYRLIVYTVQEKYAYIDFAAPNLIPNFIDINLYLLEEDVTKAVEERKKKEEKDKRNLYLANEGLIREGTKVG